MHEDAFADSLNHFVARTAYTPGQLARLSGLPKSTIVNWTIGRVQQPRDWQPLLRLLAVLRLSRSEADRVLQAAGHPTLDALQYVAATDEDTALLSPWQGANAHEGHQALGSPPFQAIADTPFFVGRQEMRRHLREQLRRGGLCTVCGMPGVGKTALATRLAYDLRAHFTEGVLWARLSASDPMSILYSFAAAFDVDLSPYADLDSRARVVRGLLADRRILLVLDDAQDSATVEALLPPSGPGAVLVTTRKRNLAVAQRGRRFVLMPFTSDGQASAQLFAHFLGDESARSEAEALSRLARFLGHLPLALAIAAARLAWEPGWDAQQFLDRLQTMDQPLQALQADERGVYRAFLTSFEELALSDRHLFAALSAFGGDDFSARGAAATGGLSLPDAQETLRRLHGLSLLQAPAPDRYRLHPLLHQFAAALPQDPQTARRFLVYVAGLVEHLQDDDAAIARALPHALRALQIAGELGQNTRAADMTLALAPSLMRQGRLDLATELLKPTLPPMLPSPLRARRALILAQIARLQRRFAVCARLLDEADSLAADEPEILIALLAERGTLIACQGNYQEAYEQLGAALARSHQVAQPAVRATIRKELGATCVALGKYDEAEGHYLEAYREAEEQASRHLPSLLRCLGSVAILARNDYQAARVRFEDALQRARQGTATHDQALILNNLAAVAWYEGDGQEARAYLRQAQTLAEQMQLPAVANILRQNVERLARAERLRIIFD